MTDHGTHPGIPCNNANLFVGTARTHFMEIHDVCAPVLFVPLWGLLCYSGGDGGKRALIVP